MRIHRSSTLKITHQFLCTFPYLLCSLNQFPRALIISYNTLSMTDSFSLNSKSCTITNSHALIVNFHALSSILMNSNQLCALINSIGTDINFHAFSHQPSCVSVDSPKINFHALSLTPSTHYQLLRTLINSHACAPIDRLRSHQR